MEEWRNIKGYEGLYQVSNYGRVKSLDRWETIGCNTKRFRKGRMLKLAKDKYGYLKVDISKNGKRKQYSIHRLVAQAFIDNPDNLPCINHKDENPSNNNVDNLEWCSYQYNTNYGTGIQRRADKMINGKCSKKVYQYTIDGNFVKVYPSGKEIQRQLGFAQSHINRCCLGKCKTAYGFIWKYA